MGKNKRKKEHRGPVLTFSLADLVMMQMVGPFDQFLQLIQELQEAPQTSPKSSRKELSRIVEETRAGATTPKLFSAIVEKTIGGQVGDPYAFLRELSQNGRDAYPADTLFKPVDFTLEQRESRKRKGKSAHYLLRVRDIGVGMDISSVVRDLLIPYNSGKEFDPQKIGEHGIGWYSVVDVAREVLVATKPEKSSEAAVARVYQEGEWKVDLSLSEGNLPLHREMLHGTEVQVLLNDRMISLPQSSSQSSDGKASLEEVQHRITQGLLHYVGLVNPGEAQITFQGQQVNVLAQQFRQGRPLSIVVGKKNSEENLGELRMGVSKRRFHPVETELELEQHRPMCYTQMGQFISQEPATLTQHSLHNAFLSNLQNLGLEFWVDVPRGATSTKGRNSIIADHQAAIMDGAHQAFENLFLENILSDEEILHHDTGMLLRHLAEVFRGEYTKSVTRFEQANYSRGRRVLNSFAAFGSGTIDTAVALGTLAADFSINAYQELKSWARENKKNIALTAAALASLMPVGYGLYVAARWVYERSGLLPFAIGGGALAALGLSWGVNEYGPAVVDKISSAGRWMKKVGEGEASPQGILELVNELSEDLLHALGLYTNLEEKREKKRRKERKKIAQKYLSTIYQNTFLEKIMHKEVIPALYYYSPEKEMNELEARGKEIPSTKHQSFPAGKFGTKRQNPSTKSDRTQIKNQNQQPSSQDSRLGLQDFADLLGLNQSSALPTAPHAVLEEKPWTSQASQVSSAHKKPTLQQRQVYLSIDTLVEAYLSRRLQYQRGEGRPFSYFSQGDYFVEYQHPLAQTVIDTLEELSEKVKTKYDVKLLEDRLESIISFAKETAVIAYFSSGLGLAHLLIHYALKKEGTPFGESVFFNILKGTGDIFKAVGQETKKSIQQWYAQHQEEQAQKISSSQSFLERAVAKVPTVAYAPFSFIRHLGKSVYLGIRENFINPFREFSSQWRAYLAERRKQGMQEREGEQHGEGGKQTADHSEKDKVKPSWVLRFLGYCYDEYTFIAADFQRLTFKNYPAQKIEEGLRKNKVGGEYITFIRIIEETNRFIADTLHQEPLHIRYALKMFSHHYETHGFYSSPHDRGKLHIDLNDTFSLQRRLCPDLSLDSPALSEHGEVRAEDTGYLILELLLQERVYQALPAETDWMKLRAGERKGEIIKLFDDTAYLQKAAWRRTVLAHWGEFHFRERLQHLAEEKQQQGIVDTPERLRHTFDVAWYLKRK